MGKVNAEILMNEDIAKTRHPRPVDVGMGIAEFHREVLCRLASYLKAANNGVNQELAVNELLLLLPGQKIRYVLQ